MASILQMAATGLDENVSSNDFAPEKTIVVSVQEPTEEGTDITAFANEERFHRSFAFYSDTVKQHMTVSYGIAGNQDSSAPTFLFVGGMYGGRWNALWVDYLCTKKGVRGIFVDRPGLGRSTPVLLAQRVEFWLETLPLLLKEVSTQCVHLVAHSGGVIYALNTLVRQPELLVQNAPIYLLSPWVHPSKSGVKTLSLMKVMPAGVAKAMNKVTSFMAKTFLSDKPDDDNKGPQVSELLPKESKLMETCGTSAVETVRRRNYFIKRFFAEDSSGCADELLLGVKDTKHWGVCGNFDDFVSQIIEQTEVSGSKPLFEVVFGLNDTFIGKGGIKYFNDVWTGAEGRSALDYKHKELEGLEHDGPVLPENGVLEDILDTIVRHQ